MGSVSVDLRGFGEYLRGLVEGLIRVQDVADDYLVASLRVLEEHGIGRMVEKWVKSKELGDLSRLLCLKFTEGGVIACEALLRFGLPGNLELFRSVFEIPYVDFGAELLDFSSGRVSAYTLGVFASVFALLEPHKVLYLYSYLCLDNDALLKVASKQGDKDFLKAVEHIKRFSNTLRIRCRDFVEVLRFGLRRVCRLLLGSLEGVSIPCDDFDEFGLALLEANAGLLKLVPGNVFAVAVKGAEHEIRSFVKEFRDFGVKIVASDVASVGELPGRLDMLEWFLIEKGYKLKPITGKKSRVPNPTSALPPHLTVVRPPNYGGMLAYDYVFNGLESVLIKWFRLGYLSSPDYASYLFTVLPKDEAFRALALSLLELRKAKGR